MTSEEERAVAALSGGLPPRRGSRQPRPSGAALSMPAFMRPPPDPAARAARIATGAEGPGGANHLARLEGLAAGGRTPVEYRDDEEAYHGYNELTNAAREVENNDNGLYSDNNNGSIPAPALSSGQDPLLICFAALLKGLFNVTVPPPAGDEETFFRGCIGPLTEAVCARYGAGKPGDAMREARLPKLPALLRAEKEGRSGTLTETGQPELRQSAPEWQQRT